MGVLGDPRAPSTCHRHSHSSGGDEDALSAHSEISIMAPADVQGPESGNSLALLKYVAKLHGPDLRESSADPDAASVDDSFSS